MYTNNTELRQYDSGLTLQCEPPHGNEGWGGNIVYDYAYDDVHLDIVVYWQFWLSI